MPKTKRESNRKDKVNTYKKQHKKELIMAQAQANQAQANLPQVREVPTWKSDDKIEVTGLEFELIYNAIQNLSNAFAATNSIMSRNILNGTIKMNFEKLNEQGSYVPLEGEELTTKQEEYQTLINSILSQQKAASEVQSEPVADTMPEEFTKVDAETGVPVIQLNP